MHAIQLIHYRDRPVAIVTAGRAIVSERVSPADLPIVRAMCAYALEVQAGDRPGPYRNADAEAHALEMQARPRTWPGLFRDRPCRRSGVSRERR